MTPNDSRNVADGPLHGRGIVVTRPAHQAQALARRIREAGGTVILFPLIDIRPVAEEGPVRALWSRVAEFDYAIFISANAVSFGWALRDAHEPLPRHVRFAAVGAGTAKALAAHGIAEVLTPQARYDSEALLELPQFTQVAGKHIVIFRGRGGREWLASVLSERGAKVEYAECYERTGPKADATALMAAWSAHALDAITVTSSEALRNLWDLLPEAGRALLRATPLFVTHERIAAAACALGLDGVIETDAGDAGLMQALLRHFAQH